jgi:hypothetical protein
MAAANTYTQIASTTLSTAGTSVTFSSIAGIYTDLVLVVQASLTANAGDLALQFNGDTATNYSMTYLTGTGSAASSGRETSKAFITCDWNSGVTTSQGNTMHIMNIMNYANATTYKTVLARGNGAATGTDAVVGLWRSTSAITSILIKTANTQTFAVGSLFNLYGITAA